jgi:hypothetical protein
LKLPRKVFEALSLDPQVGCIHDQSLFSNIDIPLRDLRTFGVCLADFHAGNAPGSEIGHPNLFLGQELIMTPDAPVFKAAGLPSAESLVA